MSFWEFHMTVDGYKRANSAPSDNTADEDIDRGPPTDDRFAALLKQYNGEG